MTHLEDTGIGAQAVARCIAWREKPFSDDDGALTRRFLTPAHRAAIDCLTGWMQGAGMQVRLDEAGTLIGRYEGTQPGKTLLIGSHIDSVRDAGAFDGTLGVMLGLGCVEHLARTGKRFPFAIEILAFGDEEGSRFHASMVGSRALAGTLAEDVSAYKDESGMTLAEAMRDFGLDAALIPRAARQREEICLYFEPHIEQGPVLEAENLPVGIVTGIAAQTRLKITIRGIANHAGTTPMHLRHDALAAAAEAALLIERIARDAGIVGTVGTLEAAPGVSNVVPGRALFSIDLRAPTAQARDTAEAAFRTGLTELCARRGVTPAVETAQSLAPCFCDAHAQALLAQSIAALGIAPFHLPSGAGHDAMSIAALAPVAMLFIRCRAGISHNPAEHAEPADVETAAQVMLDFLERLAAA